MRFSNLDETADEMAGYIRGKRDTKEFVIKCIKEMIQDIESLTDRDTEDWASIYPSDVLERLERMVDTTEKF
jgi:hypothetical protein